MSELSKRINSFFKEATKTEVNKIREEAIFNEHLEKVFKMFYIENQDINYIAYQLKCSKGKIEADLRQIRKKLNKLI